MPWIGSGFACQSECGYGYDCCPKPVVEITDRPGAGLHYRIGDADEAEITVECDEAAPSTTPITLIDGKASEDYDIAEGDVCFVSITATNACGSTTRYWRNYTVPELCDCITKANDLPSQWGRAGTIVTTISGSTSPPVPLVIGGSTVCASPSDCGDISGSFVKVCPHSSKRYLVTSPTGCGTYHYYLDVLDLSGFANYPSPFPVYSSRMFIQSGWFQKASNPYPTLTEVTVGTSLITLLGVGSFNPRTTRDILMRVDYAANFAPSSGMLKCYRGTLTGSGGIFAASYDNIDVPSSSNQGHCDLSGLVLTAEVID